MVLLIIIPIKWLFVWEYTLFSDKPIWQLETRKCSTAKSTRTWSFSFTHHIWLPKGILNVAMYVHKTGSELTVRTCPLQHPHTSGRKKELPTSESIRTFHPAVRLCKTWNPHGQPSDIQGSMVRYVRCVRQGWLRKEQTIWNCRMMVFMMFNDGHHDG